eukprot:TRINITY_DN5037_c0_g1_i1.p1 TRINITY_DN5037_c0_g1~~TRINITY_DN5037_c0_g1_i1.p1  ORF type:complete len:281 (+),score=49.34 TRINITY_DN5037_c0_g1_i1:77-919(+)
MRHLINGILDFRRRFLPELADVFKKLDNGQQPDCLFVACSDSRVVPNLFASTNPGEMFVVRNVGNLIPPCTKGHTKTKEVERYVDSSGAALEFSTIGLNIRNIVVCGHSKCGAMVALNTCHGDTTAMTKDKPYIANWLHNAKPSLDRLNEYRRTKKPIVFKGLSVDGDILAHIDIENLSEEDQLSQVNVLQQLEHISSYDVVARRIKNHELILHAWWFNISNAEVWAYSERKQRFLLLDEERAQGLLEKISQIESGNFDPTTFRPPPWLAGITPKKNNSQ